MPDTVSLLQPNGPLRVDYDPAALEQVRVRAHEGLMAMPRVPVGIGGLLTGNHDNNRVAIVDIREIICSHANGPSFSLTNAEREQCRELISGVLARPGVRVVGWYCSKPRGDLRLSDWDLDFYREFFPENWQLAMLAGPTPLGAMHAAFFYRNQAGSTIRAIETVVNAWRAPEEPKPAPVSLSGPVLPEPEPLDIEAADVPFSAPRASEPSIVARDNKPVPGLFGVPGLEPPRPHTRVSTTTILFSIVTALAVLVAAGALTEDYWYPRPALRMTSSLNKDDLVIRWNSAAVKRSERGSLYINDEGNLQTFPLGRDQLDAGFFIYKPKGTNVTARLNAEGITAMTAWFGTVPPGSSEPPPKSAQ